MSFMEKLNNAERMSKSQKPSPIKERIRACIETSRKQSTRKASSLNTSVDSYTSRTNSLDITPEMAAKVAREYLLPIFQYDLRKKSQPKRNSLTAKLEGSKGTVLEDIKLSDKLYSELQHLKLELESRTREFTKAQQEKELATKDYDFVKQQLIGKESDFKVLSYEYEMLLKENQSLKQELSQFKETLTNYDSQFYELESRKKELEKTLHEEKANNDIRFFYYLYFP